MARYNRLLGESRRSGGLLPGGSKKINLTDLLKPDYQSFGQQEQKPETTRGFLPDLEDEFNPYQSYDALRGEYDKPIGNTRLSEAGIGGGDAEGAFGLGAGIGTKSEMAKGRMASSLTGAGSQGPTPGGAESAGEGLGAEAAEAGIGGTHGGARSSDLQGTFEDRFQSFLESQGGKLADSLKEMGKRQQTASGGFDVPTAAINENYAQNRADYEAANPGFSADDAAQFEVGNDLLKQSGFDGSEGMQYDIQRTPGGAESGSSINVPGALGSGLSTALGLYSLYGGIKEGDIPSIAMGALNTGTGLYGMAGSGLLGSGAQEFARGIADMISTGSRAVQGGAQLAGGTAQAVGTGTSTGTSLASSAGGWGNIAAAAIPALLGWGISELTGDAGAGQAAATGASLIAAVAMQSGVGIVLAGAAAILAGALEVDAQNSKFMRSRKFTADQLQGLSEIGFPNFMYELGQTRTPEDVQGAVSRLAENPRVNWHNVNQRLQFENVDDPRNFQITGGYKEGDKSLPEVNEAMRNAIDKRLQMIEAAQAGDVGAQTLLDYTSQASQRARDQWIQSNYTPYEFYDQTEHMNNLQNELQQLRALRQWDETAYGSQSRWTGTPEQEARLANMENRMRPDYQGADSLIDPMVRNPEMVMQHLKNPGAKAQMFSPLETYSWESYLQDNPTAVEQLSTYLQQQEEARARMQAQAGQMQPGMPLDFSQMTPEEQDMYRKWLGSGGSDEDFYRRWFGSGVDEDYPYYAQGLR